MRVLYSSIKGKEELRGDCECVPKRKRKRASLNPACVCYAKITIEREKVV